MEYATYYGYSNDDVWHGQPDSPLKPRNAQQGIQSVEVGTRLLRALAARPQARMLRDLAAAAEMPAAKAHRYLVSLMRAGLVEQQSDSGLYALGPFSLELGLAALSALDPVSAAAPALAELRGELEQTVALAVWANRGATIVRWLGAEVPVTASLRVGSVMPLTRSATGGAFLAFLPRARTAVPLRQELRENVRSGLHPCTAAEVERWTAETRRRGFAYTSRFIPGISGAAAPVFDTAGTMVLAIVALGYSKPFDADLRRIAARLSDKAALLSHRFGYRDRRRGSIRTSRLGRHP